MKLTDFRVLTFDCYGTLIDWESGLFAAMQPLLTRGAIALGRDAVLEQFAQRESAQEAATPGMIYSDLLAEVHRQLATAWNVPMTEAEHRRFGGSVPDWPEFPDSAAALRYLGQHYKLVILSNVDRKSFQASNQRLAVQFYAIYTAQDVGSYKPDPANFRYMLDPPRRPRLRQGGDPAYGAKPVSRSLARETAWPRHGLDRPAPRP